jgi:hypothetical protein
VYFFANGDRYTGDFKDGLRTGKGTYTAADGRKREGIWGQNEFVRSDKLGPGTIRK